MLPPFGACSCRESDRQNRKGGSPPQIERYTRFARAIYPRIRSDAIYLRCKCDMTAFGGREGRGRRNASPTRGSGSFNVGADIIRPHKMAILPNLEVVNHLITRFRGSFPSRGSLTSAAGGYIALENRFRGFLPFLLSIIYYLLSFIYGRLITAPTVHTGGYYPPP